MNFIFVVILDLVLEQLSGGGTKPNYLPVKRVRTASCIAGVIDAVNSFKTDRRLRECFKDRNWI
jgi:hypothetical protein